MGTIPVMYISELTPRYTDRRYSHVSISDHETDVAELLRSGYRRIRALILLQNSSARPEHCRPSTVCLRTLNCIDAC